MDLVYLDNNATTRVDPLVLEAMLPHLEGHAGNPSSIHAAGREARSAVHRARHTIAGVLGAETDEIVFTSGGTEADALAILGIARARARAGHGRHVITTAIEHEAVLDSLPILEREGFETTVVPVDNVGCVELGALEASLRDDTALVSVMSASNEVGTIQPLDAIAEMLRERDIPFHSDAVQALGKIPMSVDTPHVDALTLSAHKIHGPKGVGALFVRKGTPIDPLFGGGGQEGQRRSGTENVAGIVGFARAVELAVERQATAARHMKQLSEAFLGRILDRIADVELNGSPDDRLPNTLNLSFAGVDSEALVISLDLASVAVSAGSACASGSLEPSHVLGAMGLAHERVKSAIRISMSRETTAEDLERTFLALENAIHRIRSVRRNDLRSGDSA